MESTYQVYWDLGKIDPNSVKTVEEEVSYNKSLLYGCKNCDLILPSQIGMTTHICSWNGKSKYEQHNQEAFNRNIDRKLNTHI